MQPGPQVRQSLGDVVVFEDFRPEIGSGAVPIQNLRKLESSRSYCTRGFEFGPHAAAPDRGRATSARVRCGPDAPPRCGGLLAAPRTRPKDSMISASGWPIHPGCTSTSTPGLPGHLPGDVDDGPVPWSVAAPMRSSTAGEATGSTPGPAARCRRRRSPDRPEAVPNGAIRKPIVRRLAQGRSSPAAAPPARRGASSRAWRAGAAWRGWRTGRRRPDQGAQAIQPVVSDCRARRQVGARVAPRVRASIRRLSVWAICVLLHLSAAMRAC